MILARVISFVFHPLLMATYLFFLFAMLFPVAFDPIKEEATWKFIFIIFCVTFVLPALNIGLFKTFGTISTLAMKERRERLVPFVFISVLYTAVTYLFYSRNEVSFNDNFLKFLLVIDALVVVSTVVTFFYKVSVHSIAAWGFIGILFPLNSLSDTGVLLYPTIISIVIAGVIMSARLKLQVHTVREVMVGAVLGLGTSIGAMTFLFRY